VQLVLDELNAGRGGWIITMNLDHLRRFAHDQTYARFHSQANLVTADGMPLVWASRLQGTPLPERVTGADLIWSLSEAAALHGRSIFLLGGSRNTAQRAAQILQQTYPGLEVKGAVGPAYGLENSKARLAQLASAIVAASPDILYIALGSPRQEKVIEELRPLLPRSWWLGVGNSFSVVAKETARAPVWMQQTGLEWLHRLGHEPRRLAKRYLVEGMPFAFALFGSAVWHNYFDPKATDRTR
jgi:N-acetylglucosaminyldiphosphoundecaprenol N-acetyl-beta-D-mannosaminyltransferase